MPSYIWLGDSLTLSAVAGTEPRMPCYRRLFTAADQPTRFSYHSANPLVADVSARGLLVGRTLGFTTLTATVDGVTSEALPVIVAPRIAALRLGVPAGTPRIGDTLMISVDAVDSLGSVVPGAQVTYLLSSPLDSVLTLLAEPRMPVPYVSTATPFSLRLRAGRAGSAGLVVTAPHEVPGPRLTVTASVTVKVTP